MKQDGVWRTILQNISFSLEKGETLGIVGESGSGKSVTALSVMRLLNVKQSRIDTGNITFFDHDKPQPIDINKLSEKEIRDIRGKRIAMIFQEPMSSLNPVIKCGVQVMEALLLHTNTNKKEAKKRVLKLFDEVQLPLPEKIFNSYPHELSGGQKQRIMIAMAISCHPDILIADEPTTALDVTVQKNILELIKKLQEKHNMSVIFITHDLNIVSEIADKIIVLYKGSIVEKGDTKTIFSTPQHPYTKGLLVCRPPLDIRLKILPTVDQFVKSAQDDKNEKFDAIFSGLIVTDKERKSFHQKIFAEKPIIRLENIHKKYPIRKKNIFEKQQFASILDNINLDIYEGETLGLVGESGCGKTTLGRTMLRLVEPTFGKIYYKGIDLTQLTISQMRSVRKELQIILQDPYSSLNQKLTIGEILMEPMKVHGIFSNDKERRRKAIELLERVNLKESHLYRYPHEFSGGQRQRISFARALTVNPKFIICDESVSALDVSVQAQVLNLLNELKKDFHFTYLFISHDLSVVKFMSDRMAVMQKGEIVELNDADSVYTKPETEYTKKLIDAIPKATGIS